MAVNTFPTFITCSFHICVWPAPALSSLVFAAMMGQNRDMMTANILVTPSLSLSKRAMDPMPSIMAPNERPMKLPTGPSVSAVYLSGEAPDSAKQLGSAYSPAPNEAW